MSEYIGGIKITLPDGSEKEYKVAHSTINYTNIPQLDAALLGFYWGGYNGVPEDITAVKDNTNGCIIVSAGNAEIARLYKGYNYVSYAGGGYVVKAFLSSLPDVTGSIELSDEARDIAYSPVVSICEDIYAHIDEVHTTVSEDMIWQGIAINSLNSTHKPSMVYKRDGERYQVIYDEMLADNVNKFTTDKILTDVMYMDCTGVEDLRDVFGGKDYGGNQVNNRPLRSIVLANVIPAKNGLDRTFAGLRSLQYLRIESIDTSAVDRMQFAFKYTSIEVCDMSEWDLSNMKYLSQCWGGCGALRSIKFPSSMCRDVTSLDLQETFMGCAKLEAVDLSMLPSTVKITRMAQCFQSCQGVKSIDMGLADYGGTTVGSYSFWNCYALVDFSGLMNVKMSYSLAYSYLLSYESAIASIDRLGDLTEGGTVTDYTAQTLTFHSTVKAQLSDEDIAIATVKGWNIAG